MNYRSYVYILLLVKLTMAFAKQEPVQGNPVGLTTVIPPGPTAAALGEYGEYNVDLASGVPAISIPLLTINSGNLSLPVTLSYHAGGNKVEENASWVGLGWSLNAGGVITRTVRGLPDDTPGYGYWDFSTPFQNKTSFLQEDYGLMLSVANGYADAEPDLYAFNFNGYSGQFFIDQQRKVHLKTHQNIHIEWLPDGEGFAVLTEDGTRYNFTVKEETTFAYKGIDYTSSWYLASVVSADNEDRIDFTYQNHALTYPIQKTVIKRFEFDTPGSHQLLPDEQDISESVQKVSIPQSRKPDEITFKGGRVKFYMSADGTSEAQLNRIELLNISNSIVSEVLLMQDYFSVIANKCNGKDCKRSRLTEIKINDQDYLFKYNESPFPPKDSPDKDHWGYYNAAGNGSPIPDFESRNWEHQDFTNFQHVTVGDGANRMSNEEAMKIGILQEIIYPTGGSTKFEFEANKFYYFDQPGGNVVDIDVPMTFHLNVVDPVHVLTSDFDYSSSSFLVPVDGPAIADIGWHPDIKVDVTFGTTPQTFIDDYNGSPKVQLFEPGGDYSQTINYVYPNAADFDAYEGVYKSKFSGWFRSSPSTLNTLRLQTGTDVGNYVNAKMIAKGWYHAQEPVDGDGHMLFGGLRIKTIKSFDCDDQFMSGKKYNYDKTTGKSSAVVLRGEWSDYTVKNYPLLYSEKYEYQYGCYALTPDKNFKFLVLHDNPVTSLGEGGPLVMYKVVKEILLDKDDNNGVGYNEYVHDIIADEFMPEHVQYPYAPRKDQSWMRGQLLEKNVYKFAGNASPILIRSEKFDYDQETLPYKIKGLKLVHNRIWHLDAVSSCDYGFNYQNIIQFAYKFYELTSHRKYPVKLTVKEFEGENTLTTTTDYYYTNTTDFSGKAVRLMRSKVVSTEGDSKAIKEEYTYPFDIPETNTALYSWANYMNFSHVISKPVEERRYRVEEGTDKLVFAKLTTYLSGFKPTSVYTLQLDAPLTGFQKCEEQTGLDSRYRPELNISYINGRISSQRKRDGVGIHYLWNDNVNPSAQIVSPDGLSFRHTSFEESPIGGSWTATALTLNTTRGKTGSAYGILNSNSNISTTNLVPGSYKVSLWIEDGSVQLALNQNPQTVSITPGPAGSWRFCEATIEISSLSDEVVISGSTQIDELRLHSVNAEMTTYAYKPLVGIISITDANHNSVYYEYDKENRLQYVLDKDKNIIKSYDYHYKGPQQ